jgi:hypothetical protein
MKLENLSPPQQKPFLFCLVLKLNAMKTSINRFVFSIRVFRYFTGVWKRIAVFIGYDDALLANRSFETSVTDYRMTEFLIPEPNLCHLQTPQRGIAEDLKFSFVNLVITYF